MRLSIALLALAAATGAPAAKGPASSSTPAADAPSELVRQVDDLRRRVALARGDGFYLELDVAASMLRLVTNGVTLREYPVRAVEVGMPRVAFFRRGNEAWARLSVQEGGELQPPRPERRVAIIPGKADAEPPPLPPTAEEAFPVPTSYRIAYRSRFALQVTSCFPDDENARRHSFGPSLLSAFAGRMRDLPLALFGESVRLRVMLDRGDAEHLYRSLPPGSRLLVAEL